MNFIKRNILALAFLLSAFCFQNFASAQPYYTNTTGASGAYLPNPNVVPATQPSLTIARQNALGINSGTIAATANLTATNSFSTNYVYSVAPVVTASTSTTATIAVTTVTTTNVIFTTSATNAIIYWTAIGK